MRVILHPFPPGLEPTCNGLHAYAQAVGAVARTHAVVHPNWWHLGLTVRPDGLVTVPIPLDSGGTLAVRFDPAAAAVEAVSSGGEEVAIGLDGATPTELAEELIRFVARCGLAGDLDLGRVPPGPVEVDWDVAAAYTATLIDIERTLEQHRVTLGTAAGPLLVWPHGFDLSFEWFGTRMVAGEDGEAPAQLNLGFSPFHGGYFYSNPWPFDEALVDTPLPDGASWHLDGWQGTILPYDQVGGLEDGADRVLAYAAAVHRVARPTLDA